MPPLNEPSLRERLRPAELVGLSATIGVFTGLVILLTTREWLFAVIGFGVAFIAGAVTIALLALYEKPNSSELQDLADQDRSAKGKFDH
ncbi:MAG: hypothetical protein KF867_01660 [Cryobacterium sp.]|nr:hypothetical protein [Cryobacterium sp.]MBX3103660.1 hypothetical protein [Cryobacterium sp.]